MDFLYKDRAKRLDYILKGRKVWHVIIRRSAIKTMQARDVTSIQEFALPKPYVPKRVGFAGGIHCLQKAQPLKICRNSFAIRCVTNICEISLNVRPVWMTANKTALCATPRLLYCNLHHQKGGTSSCTCIFQISSVKGVVLKELGTGCEGRYLEKPE